MAREKEASMRMYQKKVSIDDRTEEYIRKRVQKIEKLLEKFSKTGIETEIYIDKKGKFHVDMMIETPYRLYRVEEVSESIEGSVDLAVDNIKNQIVKDKDKFKDLQERGARSIKKKTVLTSEARFRR
jgi:ribosomal subunit interface protein